MGAKPTAKRPQSPYERGVNGGGSRCPHRAQIADLYPDVDVVDDADLVMEARAIDGLAIATRPGASIRWCGTSCWTERNGCRPCVIGRPGIGVGNRSGSVVASMVGNPDWAATPAEMFPRYRDALATLTGPGVALADLTAVWQEYVSILAGGSWRGTALA